MEKIRNISLGVVFALLLLLSSISFMACNDKEIEVEALVEQKQDTLISVKLDTEEVLTNVRFDVLHNGKTVLSQNMNNVTSNIFNISMPFYGQFELKANVQTKAGNKVISENVDVFADEYNIAPLTGSMPVTLFSMMLANADDEIVSHDVPTYVWLARSGSWNWNNLPNNVHAMPNATIDEILTHDNYNVMVEKTSEYIKELNEMNEGKSKINLYLNDFNNYLYMKMLIGQNVQNYSVKLLSDGTASYAEFNKVFANENPNEKYNQMVENLLTLENQVKEKGDYYFSTTDFAVNTSDFRTYAYVSAKENENIDWILTRFDGTLKSTPEFLLDAKSYVIEKNIGNSLKDLNENEKTTLKSLYNLSSDMFADAEKAGKKVMMFLGTRVASEADFVNYAKFTMAYYGDEYMYYYKGHPATPTGLSSVKQEQLKSLGIKDIESSIAAELILFFNPDIYMSGYAGSSTYLYFGETEEGKIKGDEQCLSAWNTNYESGVSTAGGEYMELFISKLSNDDSVYASLLKDKTHTYYLGEEKENEKYDTVIFDANTNEMKYYKKQNNDGKITFVEVLEIE